jgi:hypothetical protein
MSASTGTTSSASVYTTPAFWERLWRTAGIQSLACFIVAYIVHGLNDFVWAGFVLTSFPRAMLIMSAAFGLWRARLISNALFAVGVAVVVLVLLGGTTWLSGGLWAADGVYSRFVSPAIGLVWGMVVSGCS